MKRQHTSSIPTGMNFIADFSYWFIYTLLSSAAISLAVYLFLGNITY
jgi:hypothetical protein